MSPAMRDALQALAQPTDPTAELAREELARRRARLDVRGLLGLCADVALQHDVRLDELLCGTEALALDARRDAWTRMYRARMLSFTEIARLWGARRTAVRDAVRAFECATTREGLRAA